MNENTKRNLKIAKDILIGVANFLGSLDINLEGDESTDELKSLSIKNSNSKDNRLVFNADYDKGKLKFNVSIDPTTKDKKLVKPEVLKLENKKEED